MSRPASMGNRIVDGLVTLLKQDVTDNLSLWVEVPQTIERGFFPDMEQRPRPALFVSSNGTETPVDQRPQGLQLSRKAVRVIGLTQFQRDAETAIEDLRTAVVRAFMSNRLMDSIDDPGNTTIIGRLVLGPCDIGAVSGDNGDGVFDLQVFVDYHWNTAQP